MYQFIDLFLRSRYGGPTISGSCFTEDLILPFQLRNTRLEHLHGPLKIVRAGPQFRRFLLKRLMFPHKLGNLVLHPAESLCQCVHLPNGSSNMVRCQR